VTASIRAACSPGEVRVAVTRADRLIAYAIWRPGMPDGVGDLHRGQVIAHVPALAGAFVALEAAEGFLPDTGGAADLSAGDVVGVRVTRAAQGGKGPRLSAALTRDERALVGGGRPALLRRGAGALRELAAAYPDAPVLVDDPTLSARLRPELGTRVAVVPAAFDAELAGAVAALADAEVRLRSGAVLSIHPTPALTAIDVDSAGATDGAGPKGAAQRALNQALLPELAAQIALRNLSGAILVDFAGMPTRRRTMLGPALEEALAEDRLRPRLLGFTRLGLAEIVRPRVHPPLHELLAGPHAAGLAALRAAAAAIAADPARPPRLLATPSILSALEADPYALKELAARAGRPLMMRADPGLPAPGWMLEPADG
jgi:Ribonuclease G/E